jgi:hypothetical protein
VSTSLDGASVNTGHKTGLIALWNAAAPWILLTHAVAHVVELIMTRCIKSVEYFAGSLDKTCRGVVAYYNVSAKKQANTRRIALELGETKHLKLTSFCQTRYQRALFNSMRALMTNWRQICIHTHKHAHQTVCTRVADKAECLHLASPPTAFVGRSYLRSFGGFRQMYTVSITGVRDGADSANGMDKPCFIAKVTPVTTSYIQEDLYKAEVVDQIDPSDRLNGNASYELYNSLTSARFVRSCLFLLDARCPQSELSELTQRDHVNLKSLRRKVQSVKATVQDMVTELQPNELKFDVEYLPDREIYRGIQVLNEGLDSFKADREEYLLGLAKELDDPELNVTNHPVHNARANLFDFENWPTDYSADYFQPDLDTMLKHYHCLFLAAGGSSYPAKVRRQWRDAVGYVVDMQPGARKLSFSDVWTKAHASDEVDSLAKLLIQIEIVFLIDTSAGERWFSLMNQLKWKRRNRLDDQVLNDLMFVILHAPKSIVELKKLCPEILRVWSELSVGGRYSKSWRTKQGNTVDEMNFDETRMHQEDFRGAFTAAELETAMMDLTEIDML